MRRSFSEEPGVRVAIQGEPGSNSHMAALQVFGHGALVTIVPCRVSAEVFEHLEAGSVASAVLPIENTLHGSVFEHYDLLLQHGIIIVGETMLRIHHNLIAAPGVELAAVRQVHSHPVALSQCRRWLRAHPSIDAVPAYDTAGSVKQLMQAGALDVAAIAPALAAEVYGARILLHGLEDHPENYTRFLHLKQRPAAEAAQSSPASADANKMSVAFTLEHRPGTLLAALEVFRDAAVNLTKIESRPVPGRPWEYVFFVDVRFDHPDQAARALTALGARSASLHLQGLYRAADPV